MQDFRKVYGIDTIFTKIEKYVYLDTTLLKKFAAAKKSSSTTSQPVFSKSSSYTKRALQSMDANAADSAAFETLPMIGPKLAGRMVHYRERLGFFLNLDQIKEVYGMPDSNYQIAVQYLYIGDVSICPRLKINTLDSKQLGKHPYVKPLLATRIVNYRQQHGQYRSMEDLQKVYGIDSIFVKKMRPYLDFKTP